MGIIQELLEENRQKITRDRKFLGFVDGVPQIYFFELRVPASVSPKGQSFLFPLALNPTEITVDEPFTVQVTPTQGGGLFVEENGIIQRTIRIRGHTGFRPRLFAGSHFPKFRKGDQKSYSREITMNPNIAISGQRYFQFLQDHVFRSYGDLKKDPETSADTFLIWHNQKDDEHWIVVPQKFRLERTAAKRILYEYDIELLAVADAKVVDKDFSEDKDWLDKVKDGIRMVKSGIDAVSSVIRDLTAVVNDIKLIVSDIDKTFNAAIDIVNAAEDFISGTTDLIKTPFESVLGLQNRLDSALQNITDAIEDGTLLFPDTIPALIRQIGDGFDRMGTHPELFQSKAETRLERLRELQDLSSATHRNRLSIAAGEDPPSSLDAFRALGTKNLPGDQERARAELGIGRSLAKFSSIREHRLESGDTLPNLAGRFLDDARQWRVLAILNDLQPPYISERRLPGTLQPGDRISVPSTATAPERLALSVILGARPTESAEDRFLGVDWELARDSKGFFDMAVDVEGGSVDAKRIRGIKNLGQAVIIRIDTEQGSDILYNRLGQKRVFGTTILGLDRELAGFRVGEAVGADPRIATVRNVRLNAVVAEQPDVADVELDAEVRGFDAPVTFEI